MFQNYLLSSITLQFFLINFDHEINKKFDLVSLASQDIFLKVFILHFKSFFSEDFHHVEYARFIFGFLKLLFFYRLENK